MKQSEPPPLCPDVLRTAPAPPVDDDLPLDPEAAAEALLLSLMARLLAPRGAVALTDDGALRVVAARGVTTDATLDEAGLSTLGLPVALPLRHGGETVGLVALAPPATGQESSASDLAVARSLAAAAAASIRAARAASDLADSNRDLARRAQELATLLELAQALGRTLDRADVVRRLGFALLGQLVVRRGAVALGPPGGPLQVADQWGGATEALTVPAHLGALDAPTDLAADSPLRVHGFVWAVPLCAGSTRRGVALLGPRASGEPYDADAATFAASLAALAVGALETADRVAERVLRERLEGEVRLARAVQERLLPEALPAPPGLDVAAFWRPHGDVSGDAYDLATLDDGRLVVAVADVVGKGIPAALLMATLQAGLRMLRPELEAGGALADATERLDRLVAESTQIGQFVTLAWATVDPATGGVESVTAGHPALRLLRADGTVEHLDAGGPLLGVLPDATYSEGTATLAPGDALVLVSDGATEAADGSDDEFGDARLDAALAGLSGQPSASVLDALTRAVEAFCGDTPLNDDLTLVAVRREPR